MRLSDWWKRSEDRDRKWNRGVIMAMIASCKQPPAKGGGEGRRGEDEDGGEEDEEEEGRVGTEW